MQQIMPILRKLVLLGKRTAKKIWHWLVVVYGIVKRTFVTFAEARGPEASASMAYFAFFSLFPLLLSIVAMGSFVLQNENIYQIVIAFFGDVFPTSELFIADAIEKIISARGPVTLIGVVALLWSASAYFVILTRNIDRAWPHGRMRNFIQQRVTAFKMIAVVVVLLFFLLMVNTVAGLLPKLFQLIPIKDVIKDNFFWKLIPRILAWLVTYLLFLMLYRWTPASRISWKSVSLGAWTASLLWQFIAGAFGWFLKSGLINYQLVYGSLGSIAALMFWFYLSGYIILFGAHLSTSIEHYYKKQALGSGPVEPGSS